MDLSESSLADRCSPHARGSEPTRDNATAGKRGVRAGVCYGAGIDGEDPATTEPPTEEQAPDELGPA